MPLSVLLRDVLGLAKNAREGKIILAQKRVLVDGKVRRDHKFPAGLMDVIELPDADMTYRILPAVGKGLTALRISKDEGKAKLCRIEDKSTIKKGAVQLNLHDGRNILRLQTRFQLVQGIVVRSLEDRFTDARGLRGVIALHHFDNRFAVRAAH